MEPLPHSARGGRSVAVVMGGTNMDVKAPVPARAGHQQPRVHRRRSRRGGTQHRREPGPVAQALCDDSPVVALESTIISHGMPYQQNSAMALEVEGIVRECGARHHRGARRPAPGRARCRRPRSAHCTTPRGRASLAFGAGCCRFEPCPRADHPAPRPALVPGRSEPSGRNGARRPPCHTRATTPAECRRPGSCQDRDRHRRGTAPSSRCGGRRCLLAQDAPLIDDPAPGAVGLAVSDLSGHPAVVEAC